MSALVPQNVPDYRPPTVPSSSSEFRDQLAEAFALGDPELLTAMAREAVQRFGLIRGREPGEQRWSSYNVTNRVSPRELVDRALRGTARRARRGPRRPAAGGGPGRRLRARRRGRGTPAGRRGPRRRARRPQHRAAEPRPDRLHLGPQARARGDAPGDRPAGPSAGQPGAPAARQQAAGPARLPAHRAGVAVLGRGAAGDPPPAATTRRARTSWCSATSAAPWRASPTSP